MCLRVARARIADVFVFCALVPADGVRLVRFFERAHLIRSEADVDRTNRAFEMLDLGRSDDRSRYSGPLKQPCKRNFGWGSTDIRGHFADCIDHEQIGG